MRPKRTELSEKVLLRRGISKKFLNTTLNEFETPSKNLVSVKKEVQKYIDNLRENLDKGMGIFFYGLNGVGKSMLACIIVREAYIGRYSSKRITFNEYLNESTRIWSCRDNVEREELEDNFYHFIKDVNFLVLEEVGKESFKPESALPVLEDLLRHREEQNLCTFICTNMSVDEIIKRYNSSSIKSLIEGNMIPLVVVGRDRRVEK